MPSSVRPPEAARHALVGAVELLQGERVTVGAVLRQLDDARMLAGDDHLLIGQLELAIADVGHWALRCEQVERRMRELAGVETPGIEREHHTWARGQHSQSPAPASPR